VIDPVVESVEDVVAWVPNPVPTSGQLREARARAVGAFEEATRPARRPVLAAVGAAEKITRFPPRTALSVLVAGPVAVSLVVHLAGCAR
jgi:hypothetical protein